MQLIADTFIPPFPARVDGWRSPYRIFFGESQRNILHGWANEFFETWHRRQQVLGVAFHLINSPAAVGRVLLENKANYVRPRLAQRILVPFVGNGLLTAEGENWQKQRKVVAPPFAPGAVAALSDIIGSAARRQTMGWTEGDAVVDMADEATSATMAVIADALFSGDPRLTSASAHGHIDAVLKTLAAPRLTNVLNLPPLNITAMRRREARSRGYLRQSLAAMVDERGPTGGPDDFFGGLIRALHAQFPPEQAREIAIDNAITFYVAGHETTAVALTWTIVGADDRRVTPGIAAPDPAFFQHRDVGQPVHRGEVIGRRQPVPAAADDDDVISGLWRRIAPRRCPVPVAGQRVAGEREDRKARHAGVWPDVDPMPCYRHMATHA